MRKSPFLLAFLLILYCPFCLAVVDSYTLPDTGQTACYNRSGEIACRSPGEPGYGEDGNYQGSQPAYQLSGHGLLVTDLNTGLIWQQSDDGISKNWDEAIGYCEGLNLEGYSDWRMPSRMELVSIVDYGRYKPAVHPVFSSQIAGYWSATTHVKRPGRPYYVSFGSGSTESEGKTHKHYVRCVRGRTLQIGPFVDNGDGTVTDTSTTLMWTRDSIGNGEQWLRALRNCENLDLAGWDDWRLPNIRELQSIVNDGRLDAPIDPVFSLRNWEYWSSTTAVQNKPGFDTRL